MGDHILRAEGGGEAVRCATPGTAALPFQVVKMRESEPVSPPDSLNDAHVSPLPSSPNPALEPGRGSLRTAVAYGLGSGVQLAWAKLEGLAVRIVPAEGRTVE